MPNILNMTTGAGDGGIWDLVSDLGSTVSQAGASFGGDKGGGGSITDMLKKAFKSSTDMSNPNNLAQPGQVGADEFSRLLAGMGASSGGPDDGSGGAFGDLRIGML